MNIANRPTIMYRGCVVVSTPTRFRHSFDQESRGQHQFANELGLWCGFAAHDFLQQIEQLMELR
jgi:hypothetical protein